MFNIALFELWGKVTRPDALSLYPTVSEGGIGVLINLFINLLVVGAGLYALFNFILAGYGFLSAGGDSKKVSDASAKIWQSVLGLVVAAGALVLAAIFGKLLGFNILKPEIPVP
ncbi:MAG: hypothetical protein BMS9Abin21_233 [Thermodesulfovibrionia bacterium]|nr:MAG: hypothetical protein BMS9Abin21_233 [Thermodesulfovibrionia bacterium]